MKSISLLVTLGIIAFALQQDEGEMKAIESKSKLVSDSEKETLVIDCFCGNINSVVAYSMEHDFFDFVCKVDFKRADGNVISSFQSPLTAAIEGGHWDIAFFLIGKGAFVRQESSDENCRYYGSPIDQLIRLMEDDPGRNRLRMLSFIGAHNRDLLMRYGGDGGSINLNSRWFVNDTSILNFDGDAVEVLMKYRIPVVMLEETSQEFRANANLLLAFCLAFPNEKNLKLAARILKTRNLLETYKKENLPLEK